MALRLEVALDGSTTSHDWAPPRVDNRSSFCADTRCFADLVQARADPTRTIVLAMTNAGFAQFWHNLRCSLERLNVSQHAIIVGTDEAACKAATSESVPCVVGSSVLWETNIDSEGVSNAPLSQNTERHGTAEYARLMHIKARPALAALRLGVNLIFTDIDIVWMRNPLRELRRKYGPALNAGLLDVVIQSDYDESNEASCTQHEQCVRSAWCEATARCAPEVCGGFYLLRSGPPAIALLEALFARMAWQREHVDRRIGEQPALNVVLRRTPGVRYEVLPRDLYPNGNGYFVRQVWPPRGKMPVIIHNNWLAGAVAKRDRFEQHGLWLVADSGVCVEAALGPPGNV